MRRITYLVFAYMALLSIGGCFSTYRHESGKRLEQTDISRIKKNETTSIEIIKWFGSPTAITEAGESDLYVYKYCEYGGSSAYLPFLYGGSGSKEECDELTIVIDRGTGVVKDYSLQERNK